MKIGILGGTFDPIHQGHLTLAQMAQKQFGLDKILFIPAFIPPHKTSHLDLTPAPYRFRMVELAIKERPGFEISDIELNRPDISYTADTIQALHQKYPMAKFFMILGVDTLREVPKWRKPKIIYQGVEFLVAPRPGFEGRSPFGQGVHWLEMQECPISSSEIRQQIRLGKTVGEEYLPASVERYIQRMQLYRKGR